LWGKKFAKFNFYIKKFEEKPCPNDHNLKKEKMKTGEKFPSEEGKERKIKEKKRKEKLLTCFICALLERTKIQTGKKHSSLSFFCFLFSFRKKTTFCPRLFLSVFVFSASPATVRVATDVPHDHRTSHYRT
jgi:hypothetical protein